MFTSNKNVGRVIYEKSDSYSKSENATSGDVLSPVSDSFIVPEGGATAKASLTVDDWGKLSIYGPGGTFELDLTSAAADPGEMGGHQEWSKTDSFKLIPGEYTLTVTHENADLPSGEPNKSVCIYSVIVTAYEEDSGLAPSSSSSSSNDGYDWSTSSGGGEISSSSSGEDISSSSSSESFSSSNNSSSSSSSSAPSTHAARRASSSCWAPTRPWKRKWPRGTLKCSPAMK